MFFIDVFTQLSLFQYLNLTKFIYVSIPEGSLQFFIPESTVWIYGERSKPYSNKIICT